MSPTKIEWADEVWNPVTGCTPISEGCRNCYAKRMAARLKGRYGYPEDEPFRSTFHPDRLEQPFKGSNKRYFVCSMSDLFHDHVPIQTILTVFDHAEQAALKHGHTFIFLTKRPIRMKHAVEKWLEFGRLMSGLEENNPFPLWLGVSVEDQRTADERIPILLQIPAAVRFVSVEPMLGAVDLNKLPKFDIPGDGVDRCTHYEAPWDEYLHWVVCGGETGPGARPMHPDWPRGLRDQCQAAGVPFFFKQWGEWEPIGPLYHPTESQEDRQADQYGQRKIIYPNGIFCDPCFQPRPDAYLVERVGKKRAGCLLDGQVWAQMPSLIEFQGVRS